MAHVRKPYDLVCAACDLPVEQWSDQPICAGKPLVPSLTAPLTVVEKEMMATDPDLPKLGNWFSYHPPPDQETVIAYRQLREAGLLMARAICMHCPPSADRSAALRKVREAVMTANASIACGGK